MKVKKVTEVVLDDEDFNVCLKFSERRNNKREIILDLDEHQSYMYTTPKIAVKLFRKWADQLEDYYKIVKEDEVRVALP